MYVSDGEGFTYTVSKCLELSALKGKVTVTVKNDK